METQSNPNSRREVYSGAFKRGLVGINVPLGVGRSHLSAVAKQVGFPSVTLLASALILHDFPPEALEEEIEADQVHVEIPLKTWAAWVAKRDRRPGKDLGCILTHWAKQYQVEEVEKTWYDPWKMVILAQDIADTADEA